MQQLFLFARVLLLLIGLGFFPNLAVFPSQAVFPSLPVFPSLAGAQTVPPAPVIRHLRIEGNQRIEADTIKLNLSSRESAVFSRQTADSDVKQIYLTGFFDQVVAKVLRLPGENALDLVFEVKEKPAIRSVLLEGNDEVSDDTLKEKLNIGARRFLDNAKIRAAVEQAKSHYQGLGYYDAEIDYAVTPVEENQVDLTFKINEGSKLRIREVVFEGNKAIDSSDLSDAIKTSDYFWLTSWITGSGTVKKEVLEADQKEMMRFYLNRGHVDIKVGIPEVSRVENGLKVTFKIDEGAVYTISSVTATGTLLENSMEKTLEGTKTVSGDIFNVENLNKDAFAISEKFTDIGYAFANVNPDTQIHRENHTVGIEFQVDKGNEVTVNRINITGNKKTYDNVIRRSLQIQEQELFSSSKVRRSQEILQRLGYFDEVTVTPEPSGSKDQVDLNVGVREGNTGTFSVGAGISSGEGFIFQAQISENNLFGTGNSVSFDVNSGTQRENFILSFNNPRVNDTYVSLGVEGLSIKREYDDFNKHEAGGTISAGYPLWFLGSEYLEDIRGSIAYELAKIKIDDVNTDAPALIKEAAGKSTLSSITPKLVRNTINNPFDPTKGTKETLSVEAAGLGGDADFWLGQASFAGYFNLWDSDIGPFVFAQRTRIGYGESYDGDEPLPLYRRFFPGGINSVRGYESREMGPKENGNEYGGNKEFVANFEMIFPVVNSIGLKGVVFYDAGEAFDENADIELSSLRQAIGWGIRWRSPIAPIRIEIGYPLDKEDGDSSVVTNFSFGSPN